MVSAVPPIWTVNAPPTVHKTAMNIAADRTDESAPAANSTGASVAIRQRYPDVLRLASQASPTPYATHFRARIRQQIFSGSTEQLEIESEGQVLRARISARGPLFGDHEFFFEPADAIPVND